MVYLDGRPLYPKRISDTLASKLSQGDTSEQTLYDETTDYLRLVYHKAKLLNREAARLAMSVFQRRLASFTYALLLSFRRRLAKLDAIIEDIQSGKITTEQMLNIQASLHAEDILDSMTADEVARKIEGTLTKEQVAAMLAREKTLYGEGGDVAKERPRLRNEMEYETYRLLLPGYVRQYFQQAAPMVDIEIDGDTNATFSLRPRSLVAMDLLYSSLETYLEEARNRFSFDKIRENKKAIWLHPGEPVFE